MAITKVNPADFDYSKLSDAQTQAYKGKAEITISNYDNDSAPDVKVGSVFENNGTLFIVDTSDITPTGYSGIPNSTTFYLYYDESAEVFIYSSTAPTWSDSKQGWYNGNDRAFFSMYKDSGGTLYQSKSILVKTHILQTKIIEIGDWDMDTDIEVVIKHGITNPLISIKSVSVVIRRDLNGTLYDLVSGFGSSGNLTGGWKIDNTDSTQLILRRFTTGEFDNGAFSDTPYNRGWITIQYVG